MNRRLNAAFLIKFLAITLVLGVGIHLLHGFQIQRNARHFLAMAERSLEEGKLPQALTYFQHYLTIEPRDVAARVRYALVLDRKAGKGSDRLRAILEMDKILAQDPQQEEVRYRLIMNLIEMERVGQALIHVDKLLPTWSKPAELHHIRGWCLESLKKYPEAAQAFARAVELDRSRISSYELWAETLQRLPPREGEPEPAQQARAILDRMVQANEKDFQAYLARSRFLKESGAEESKADLDQAARLAPDQPAVTLALAEWHLANGDLKTARTVVEAGRAKHARDAGLIKALAGLDIRAGLPEQAITLLRGEIDALPDANDLTILLIELLIDRGHVEEAQTRLNVLHSSGSAPLLSDYLKARLAIEGKNWSDALALLERIRADLPEKSDWQSRVHALLGLCYQHLGDEERQLAAFRRAVRHEPSWAEAKLGLAAALTQTGRYDESLLLLSELLAQQNASKTRLPGLDLLHARTVLGNTLRRPERDRDWGLVDRALKQAEAESPKAAELPLLRAEVLAGQKRLDEAEKTLAEARVAHPERFSYWALAADLAARQNQLPRARQILDEAQKQLGDQLDLRLARVRLWSQGGGPEPEESIAVFTQGLGAWPVSSRVQLLRVLAETAARLGEGKQAERLWQQIAVLEPRDIRSRASLLEITLEENNPGRARTLITELRDLEGEQGMWWRYGAAALLTREGKEQPEKLDEARKMLDRLAAQHRDWGRVPLLRARIAETRGDPEGALVHYQEALRLGETNPRLVRTVISALAARKRFQDADNVLVLLEEQGPLPPDLARQGTEIALALPNLPKVRQRALQPINLESNDYRVQTWLVRIYHVLGDDARAEELARKALAQHPGTPDTWITLVGQLARTGKRMEALKIAEQSRAKVPTPVIASTVARCYEALGDLERAEAAFVQGWKEQPADFILAMQAADFFQRTDQLPKALPMLAGVLQPSSFVPREFVPRLRRQLALALVEGDASRQSKALAILDLNGKAGAESPVNQRARAFVLAADARGRPDALKRFKESLKSALAQDEELYLLALIHEKAGEIFEATDILEQLATFQPENPQYLARLTRLLAGQSRGTEARTTLERLQRLEPASFRTRQAQEAVERAGT